MILHWEEEVAGYDQPMELKSIPAKIVGLFGRRAADPLQNVFAQYERHAAHQIALGKAGQVRLAPKSIWLNISENCNLKCVGCHFEGKFRKEYTPVEEVRRAIEFQGEIEEISFTTNEAMLNPHFCDIIDLCRERHPKAKLWVITNGTIPIKGRYRAAIAKLDKVGLSIDGASKEVYESIRIGARWEDFLANAREIVRIRQETGSPREITFGFTGTATNLHELVGVVRLAHEVGATDVWAQAMEAKDDIIRNRINAMMLDRMDPALRTRLVDEARAEAQRLGIGVYFSAGIYPAPKAADAEPAEAAAAQQLHVRMCQYPNEQPVQVSRLGDKFAVRPCCYILTTKTQLLADKYGLVHDEIPTGDEVYNSPAMWSFREALVKGETGDVCGSCAAARGFAWTPTAPKT